MEYINPTEGNDSSTINLLLQLCYNCSLILVHKYQDILTRYLESYDDELTDYEQDIQDIKKTILLEHKLYHALLQQDTQNINQATNELLEKPIYTPPYLRFRNKLQFNKNISFECKTTTQELGLEDSIPQNLDFDLLLAVQAYTHIETIKTVKDILPTLVEEDSPFLSILYKYLNAQLLYKSCANDLFEIITIYSNMDIDSLPNIDFNNIKEAYYHVYNKSILAPDLMLSDTIFSLTLEELNRIKQLNNIDQDESQQLKTLFYYIYSITRIKILISKMDKATLEKTKTYCGKLNFENASIQKEIKKILKNPQDSN